MTRTAVLLFAGLAFVFVAHAETVQVPEKCAGQETPCVIRTADAEFLFKSHGYEVKVVKETILKVVKADNHVSFDILKGRIEVSELGSGAYTASLNGVLLDSKRVMALRLRESLQILDSQNFVLTRYQIKQGVYPERTSSEFLSKRDLVSFTSRYFSTVGGFKSYLSSIEKKWVAEFKLQNENQTKALLRSVASEEKAIEERVRQKTKEENELKKVKNEFFFRTFQR